ncbi:hypothetical protein D3C78_1051860 [compost metagenome]
MLGAGGTFAEQGRQGKALAAGDLEGRLGAAPGRMRPFADHATLLDDVEMLHRPVLGLDDGVAGGIEAQQAVFDEEGEVGAFHLVEGRELLQELHGAVDVLHYRLLAGLGKGVCLVHGPAFFLLVGQCCSRPGAAQIGRKSNQQRRQVRAKGYRSAANAFCTGTCLHFAHPSSEPRAKA